MVQFKNGEKVEILLGELIGEKGIIQGKSNIGTGYYNVFLENRGIEAPFYRDDLMIVSQ